MQSAAHSDSGRGRLAEGRLKRRRPPPSVDGASSAPRAALLYLYVKHTTPYCYLRAASALRLERSLLTARRLVMP